MVWKLVPFPYVLWITLKGSDIAAKEIYHRCCRRHICSVPAERTDKRMWSPFVKSVRRFSQHEKSNSLLWHIGVIAQFNLISAVHTYHCVTHVLARGLVTDIFPSVSMDTESILIVLIVYQKLVMGNYYNRWSFFFFLNLILNYMFGIWNYLNVFF